MQKCATELGTSPGMKGGGGMSASSIPPHRTTATFKLIFEAKHCKSTLSRELERAFYSLLRISRSPVFMRRSELFPYEFNSYVCWGKELAAQFQQQCSFFTALCGRVSHS